MVAYTGTIDIAGKNGEIGSQNFCRGKYALAGALANTDTITWPNLLPLAGGKIVGFRFYSLELDTNATPTMTFTVGNSDDADGYLETVNGGLPATLPANGSQLSYAGNGALIATTVTNRNVVLTVTGVVATGVAAGNLFVEIILEGV
jgi:hypothetical protein